MENKCIFCEIIAGNCPCSKVFESDTVLAFLDISPIHKGHALVVPKQHYPQIWDIPAELAVELLEAQKLVGRAILKATQADGLNILMNNYKVAGQEVMHAHYHLVPRFEDDGLLLWKGGKYASIDEMNLLAKGIRAELS